MPSLVSFSIFRALDNTFTASSVRNMELRCRPFLASLGHRNPSSFTVKSGGARGSPSLARLHESTLCLPWHPPHRATRWGAGSFWRLSHTLSVPRGFGFSSSWLLCQENLRRWVHYMLLFSPRSINIYPNLHHRRAGTFPPLSFTVSSSRGVLVLFSGCAS